MPAAKSSITHIHTYSMVLYISCTGKSPMQLSEVTETPLTKRPKYRQMIIFVSVNIFKI